MYVCMYVCMYVGVCVHTVGINRVNIFLKPILLKIIKHY